MAVPGDLPDGQGMPGIDQDPLRRRVAAAEQEQDQKNGSHIEGDHGQLHRRHPVGDAGHEEEDHLRHGRIDRAGIAGPVDIRVDRCVAQVGQSRIRGNIAVGIDSGPLDPAVPDIAVDIRREGRRRQEGAEAESQGDQKNEGNKSALPHTPGGAEDGDEVENALYQGNHDQAVDILSALNMEPEQGQEDEPDARRIEERLAEIRLHRGAASPGLPASRRRTSAFRATNSPRNLPVAGAAKPGESGCRAGGRDKASSS